ncbi:NUDIX hydrolase [Arcanobacterium ihumii]|uniref:NUDIX hydrolase n=1 Tax=Arcanobacterium ihumii TaxID=2138162 RepID=UPI001F46F7BB|nr:CoA pyrophosphatase [Arcanobacterium ihumii]
MESQSEQVKSIDNADSPPRLAAVLVLLSSAESEPSILFTERAAQMRFQAGQISFPGGSRDGQETPEETATRECFEEVGIHPSQVQIQGRLPDAVLRNNLFHVVPVLARWDGDISSCVPNPDEVAKIHLISIDDLANPENRCMWYIEDEHEGRPSWVNGPGFVIGDTFIWGLTAEITSALLKLAGWELPWDSKRLIRVPQKYFG